MRVQSKGRSMVTGVTVVIERPFDCTRKQTQFNVLSRSAKVLYAVLA